MVLSIEQLNKGFGANVVLQDITAKIEDNDRIGLIGVNGAGKSTLLNLIVGDLSPDSGVISIANGASIGFLRQNSGLSGENTIWEELRGVFRPVLEMESRLRQLEREMAADNLDHAGEQYRTLVEEYAVLDERFSKAEGYLVEVKIRTILNGMGFGDKPADSVIRTLSGGEKTRLALAKLLLEQPALLILDEPTNHLDFKTLTWLEEYLSSYKGALLLVSHDRYFLDKLVSGIWEVERHKLETYKGNYSKYVLLKKERRERQQKEYEQQQQEIAAMEDFVARNLVRASTTKRAQSRIAALERMERVEKPQSEIKTARLSFQYDREPVKDVLVVENLSLSVGEPPNRKHLASGINLHVERGNKIAIIGANGVGKSSFLKAVLKQIPVDSGAFSWGKNVKVAYYEQELKGLNPNNTALEEIWSRYPQMTEHEVRSLLGGVLLTGEAVYKKVSVLSGGEKAKLAFAVLMLQRGNVLLLDEPTNHLDLPSKEVLEEALQEYEGTLLMVSHDRYMLNRVPDFIMEFTGTGVETYQGGYDDYFAEKDRRRTKAARQEEEAPAPAKAVSASGYRTRQQKNEQIKKRQHLKDLEEEIARLEAKIAQLEEEITQPEIYANYVLMGEKCQELEETKRALSLVMEEWAQLSE
ncbi:MAG: ABC-F family ATP-binding cassette domain-containing protein [Oscillospiraceae bacterium]|nr:ABC-F family ATP-binding cassette domain-containing protein [Oscillospiraceae bacterium]